MNGDELIIKVHAAYLYRFDGCDDVATFNDRMTRCYELALHAQLNFAHRGWPVTLVHGSIGPAKNPHAWLEWRDVAGRRWCWDGVFDGIMPGTAYVNEMYAVAWTRYSPAEAARWVVRDAGNGPWGKRDTKRAIACIEAMIDAGHDREAGLVRINEIRQDDSSKKEA